MRGCKKRSRCEERCLDVLDTFFTQINEGMGTTQDADKSNKAANSGA